MLTLPAEVTAMLALVAPLVTPSVWSHAQGLVAGAILTPGNRTGTAILSVMGLRQRRPFPNYHRVRTRARWSSRAISQTWLRGLRGGFVPPGPPVLGLDDTSERRRGKRITANGIYRAPVRSSHSHFVKASGLRWLRVLVLVPMPGVGWVWALPFLPVWAPAERYHPERRRYPQELTDWARQLLRQGRRWVPPRELRVVADRSFAMLTVLDDLRHLAQPVSMITRLRWEAALYDPAPTRRQGRTGRPRVRGTRLPTLPQVLQDATTSGTSGTIAGWDRDPQRAVAMVSETAVWDHPGRPPVPLRWGVIRDPQTKFRSSRSHAPGRRNPTAVGRLGHRPYDPPLLGLFSAVTLLAPSLSVHPDVSPRQAAWYTEATPTFADALALVRSHLWRPAHFSLSHNDYDLVQIPRPLFECLTDTLCYAA
jgi:hypothetical protein